VALGFSQEGFQLAAPRSVFSSRPLQATRAPQQTSLASSFVAPVNTASTATLSLPPSPRAQTVTRTQPQPRAAAQALHRHGSARPHPASVRQSDSGRVRTRHCPRGRQAGLRARAAGAQQHGTTPRAQPPSWWSRPVARPPARARVIQAVATPSRHRPWPGAS